MPHATTLIDTLKRLLKARGITYGELATRIHMSEASVKRMFSQGNFTLQRLDQILLAAGIEFDELAQASMSQTNHVARLSLAQEREIIGDTKLLVVAVCAMNHVAFEDILRHFHLTEAEVVQALTRLDRIGFLELLPNNRVKLLISRTFSWIPNGPIQTFFREEAYADYLNSHFEGEHELFRLVNLMLSRSSSAALVERLKQVAAEFAQQHQHETRLPYEQRHAVSLMLAVRPWMPRAFKDLVRRSPTHHEAV